MIRGCAEFEEMILAGTPPGASLEDQPALDRHLETCPTCRELRLALIEDDQRLSAFVSATDGVIAGLEDRIMKEVHSLHSPPAAKPSSRAKFFSSGRVRLALAAVLVVCVFLGVDVLDRGQTGGVVWAEVLARVEEAEDFICRRIEKRTGEPDQEIVEYRSAEYGLRQEIFQKGRLAATQFIIPDEKMLYALVHRDKTYMQQRLNEEMVAEIRRQSNAGEIVKSFREQEYRNLGRKKVGGKMAEGIEIADPVEWKAVFETGTLRLWVELETQWPVRLEMEGWAAGRSVKKTIILKDFQWNAELPAEKFEVDIPRDYQLIADLKEVDVSEEGALEGLRDYAKLMGGHYPSALSFATAIAETEEYLDGKHDRYDEEAGEDLALVFSLRNACNFYRDLLTEDKDPAYHGDRVDGRDFDRVLLRWRLEDGRYRIIFGDLRTETVAAEELERLEENHR